MAKQATVQEAEVEAEEDVTPEDKKIYQKYHANFMRDPNFLARQGSGLQNALEESDQQRDRRKTKEMFFEHRAQLMDAIEVNEEAIHCNTEFET